MTDTQASHAAIAPVILSGGSGTRLWPMSTPERPKQFLPLVGDQTMFQLTALRCADPAMFGAPIIVGSARHAAMADAQLDAVGRQAATVILEPSARNTAPAIALAALAAPSPDTLLLVMPSDHVIRDSAAFLAAVSVAAPAARAGWLVTFGITPTGPETGYGYIEMADALVEGTPAHQAARFVEKPARDIAEQMLAAGNFAWNAGIFLFRADAYLDALAAHAPDMRREAQGAFDEAGRDGHYLLPDASRFAACPSDSIDYAVMEKAERVAVMPVDCGWSDVGSWDSLADIAAGDANDCRLAGDVIAIDAHNCMIRAEGVRVSVHGVRDLIVIATGDEVMILPRGESQQVKAIVGAVQAAKG